MELTNGDLEVIREVVREVDFGSVTINISANSKKLDLSVQKRVRYDNGKNISTAGVDVQKDGLVCYVPSGSRREDRKKKA